MKKPAQNQSSRSAEKSYNRRLKASPIGTAARRIIEKLRRGKNGANK